MTQIPNFEQAKTYFEERLSAHGATARGVDWNSESAQFLRFSQLAKVLPTEQPFSLLDYGCGYGALGSYLLHKEYALEQYIGFDILESMVEKASEVFHEQTQFTFTSRFEALSSVDYSIASGIFNLKLEIPNEVWTEYVVGELHKMNVLTRKGFSFNMLTRYSDAEYMKPHLYYADPCYLFDYCKTHFSRNVALLHDYEVYDFTLIVRK
ncbi:MAG: methyltransferase domain-containing protein [Anaerolineaceae bacterium]|nr:methyltransferase domain-containing protein [Anaerolineaceae bacterium]